MRTLDGRLTLLTQAKKLDISAYETRIDVQM